MQDKVLDLVVSALGQSPQPDPDGARVRMRDSEGNLVEVRPQHHVDPLAETEAVKPSEPRKRPKTLLERLEDLVVGKTQIALVTKTGRRFVGVPEEVTEELIVLAHPGAIIGPSTIMVDQIESLDYDF